MSGSAPNQNATLRLFKPRQSLTIGQLAVRSVIPRHEVVKTVGYLINRGYLTRTELGVYILTPEGEEALANGVEIRSGPIGPDTGKSRKPFADTIRQRAWNAMRIVGAFSTPDLVCAACEDPGDKDHHNIQRYCRALKEAGYLIEMPNREAGSAETSNGFKRYRLLNNTGEIAPTFRNTKKEVFDHNTKEVFPCQATRQSSNPNTPNG